MELTKQDLAILHYWLSFPEECCREWLPEEYELSDKLEKAVDFKLYDKFRKKVWKSYEESE